MAIREAIATRPDPKPDESQDLVFVTKYGRQFVRASATGEVIFGQVKNVDEMKCEPVEVQRVKVQFLEAILAVQQAINPLVTIVQVAVDDVERNVFRDAGFAAIA